MAPKAALRPFQISADSLAERLSRTTSGAWRSAMAMILPSWSAISGSLPSTSTMSSASTSG